MVVIDEELECVREQSNAACRSVAVMKDNTVVGHLPKTSARIYLKEVVRYGVALQEGEAYLKV